MKIPTRESTAVAWLAIGALAVLVVACGGGDRSSAADAAKGREHYQATCALCHGTDGEGRAKLGKALQDNSFIDRLGDEELVEFLKEGRPSWDPANERGIDMPPKGGNPALTDDNLKEIVAYLRTL